MGVVGPKALVGLPKRHLLNQYAVDLPISVERRVQDSVVLDVVDGGNQFRLAEDAVLVDEGVVVDEELAGGRQQILQGPVVLVKGRPV